MGNLARDVLFRIPVRDVIRYILFKVTSIDELDARTSSCNDSETALTNPIEYMLYRPKRTCNGFVLQMAHFYSKKTIVKKSLQHITK